MTAHRRAPLLALTALLVLALAACGDDEPNEFDPAIDSPRTTAPSVTTTVATGPTTTAAGSVVSVTVRGGSVEGPSRHRVDVNREVVIRVNSDVADELHVHGYDLNAPVGPGQPAELSFAATIHGVFEVELERSRRRLFTLEVQS
jgi:heme/copper-type cytochrome/quinol oxidase subunit 2